MLVYNEEQLASFEVLNNSISSPPVLKCSPLGQPYTLDTDASDTKIGYIHLETYEDVTHYSSGLPFSALDLQVHHQKNWQGLLQDEWRHRSVKLGKFGRLMMRRETTQS